MDNHEISIDHPIARGRTADVYDWGEGHVLKLFHRWFELESVEYEQIISRTVHTSGVKTPAVGELLQIEGRNGLIYERAAGESMLTMFQRKPWNLIRYGRMLARLHAQMHASVFDATVPMQRWKLQNKINDADALPPAVKTTLLVVLDSMPEGVCICHGDFHPANVLLSGSDATVIDWMDASRGNPLADVARTSIILLGAIASTQIQNPFLKIIVGWFHTTYLREYFRLRPGGRGEYRDWLPIIAGARLSEDIPELAEWLVLEAGKMK